MSIRRRISAFKSKNKPFGHRKREKSEKSVLLKARKALWALENRKKRKISAFKSRNKH